MSRKDYIKFANAVRIETLNSIRRMEKTENAEHLMNIRMGEIEFRRGVKVMAEHMADIFKSDNVNFDSERFFDACGL